MFTSARLFSLSLLAITACSSHALHAEEVVAGRVESQKGNTVRLCFRHGEDGSAGEQFTLSRHTIWSQPKGNAVIQSQTVGTIRIEAVDSDHCAAATLISGSAQPSDWVVRRDRS